MTRLACTNPGARPKVTLSNRPVRMALRIRAAPVSTGPAAGAFFIAGHLLAGSLNRACRKLTPALNGTYSVRDAVCPASAAEAICP